MLAKIVFLCGVILPLVQSSAVEKSENLARDHFVHPKDLRSVISGRIIGGTVVTPNAFPFQVGLMIYQGTKIYFCGGSLISNQWVLTAAHCVDMKPNYIIVLLGAHNLTNLASTTVMNTTKYKYHSGWNSDTYQNDVGLIRLPRNVTFSSSISPIDFASGNNSYAGVNGTTLGWGETETEELSLVLKKVSSTILTNNACANANADFKKIIRPMHLCTSGAGIIGSCSGDSGGPLVVNGTQVGIVSFGTTNCTLGMPSVFTRVTEFHDWIVEHAVDGANSHNSVKFAAIATIALYFFRYLM